MTTVAHAAPEDPRATEPNTGDEGADAAAAYQSFVDAYYPDARDAVRVGGPASTVPSDEAVPRSESAAVIYDVGLGVPARGVVLSATVASAVLVSVNLALTGTLSYFFDLCFVVLSLVAAMAVTRRDLFTAGVLPPLLFGAVVLVLTVTRPDAVTSAAADFSGTFLTGLANHALGLAAAYSAALLAVGGRVVASRGD